MPSIGRIETRDGKTVAVIEPDEVAQARQRDRNLAKARRARQKQVRKARKQQQREHRSASQSYKAANRNYYRVRSLHDEGSPEEKKAFRALIRAEAEWFRTYPRGGQDA